MAVADRQLFTPPVKAVASVANQTVNSATTALLTDSLIAVPATKLQLRSTIRWRLSMSKTAAGTAARSFVVQMGTLGTTSDADIITFTMPVGTAIADKAWVEISLTCRGPLSASGIICGTLTMGHNLSATGFATIPYVVMQQNSGTVDVTTAGLIFSLVCVTGLSEVITFQQIIGDTMNL